MDTRRKWSPSFFVLAIVTSWSVVIVDIKPTFLRGKTPDHDLYFKPNEKQILNHEMENKKKRLCGLNGETLTGDVRPINTRWVPHKTLHNSHKWTHQ